MTSSNGNIFRVTGPLCGEFTGSGEFPTQRPVTRSFDVFFDLRLNKRLSKQPWGWWFETPSWSLWRHRNVYPWWRHDMETLSTLLSLCEEDHRSPPRRFPSQRTIIMMGMSYSTWVWLFLKLVPSIIRIYQRQNGKYNQAVSIDVWQWVSNFISYFIMKVITYPELNHVNKRGPGS